MPTDLRNLVLQCRSMYARTDVDPRALIASWPQFVAALQRHAATVDSSTEARFARLSPSARAVEAWDSSHRRGPVTADPRASAITRLVAAAELPTDPASARRLLDDIAWSTSGQLVSRFRDAIVNEHVADRNYKAARRLAKRTTDVVTAAQELRRTMAVVSAANVLAETDLAIDDLEPGIGPLVAWEIAAGRAVNTDPSTINLAMIASVQARNSHSMIHAVSASFQRGDLAGLDAERVIDALDAMRQSWVQLSEDLEPLMAGSKLVPAYANIAAVEAAGHIVELRNAPAPDMRRNLAAVLAGNVNLAATAQLAIDSGRLVAPADAVNRMMKVLAPADLRARVDANALLRHETVALPEKLKQHLVARVGSVSDTAEWAGKVAPGVGPVEASGLDPELVSIVERTKLTFGRPGGAVSTNPTEAATTPRGHKPPTQGIER